MSTKPRIALFLFFMAAAPAGAWETSLTVLPSASVEYRGEGKVIPQSYVNRFEGETSPLYRLEFSQDPRPEGSWSFALWHTGVFGGGNYATERVPDLTTGGTYQMNELNVGFTNFFATWRRPLSRLPLEARASFSVARQIFKRRRFIVQGVDFRPTGQDDVNEISAEGLGFGLAGRHGDRLFLRWAADAHYYVQLFDAKTDASAGHIFHGEGGAGLRLTENLSVEAGGLWHHWFILSQGDRRIALPGTDGAVISWNRQETRASGAYLRLEWKLPKKGNP